MSFRTNVIENNCLKNKCHLEQMPCCTNVIQDERSFGTHVIMNKGHLVLMSFRKKMQYQKTLFKICVIGTKIALNSCQLKAKFYIKQSLLKWFLKLIFLLSTNVFQRKLLLSIDISKYILISHEYCVSCCEYQFIERPPHKY